MKISFKHRLKKYFVSCETLRFGKHFIAFGKVGKTTPLCFEVEERAPQFFAIKMSDIRNAISNESVSDFCNKSENVSLQSNVTDDLMHTVRDAVTKCKKIMQEDESIKSKTFDSCELRDVVIRCSMDDFLQLTDYLVEYKKGSRMKYDFEKDYMLIVPYMRLSIPVREILNYDDFDVVGYHGVYDELEDAMDGEALANLCIVASNKKAKEIE